MAQNYLGNMYSSGWGVNEDKAQALVWYQLSAEQGYDIAEVNLGYMYQYGQGVQADRNIAIQWYSKAAIQGNVAALRCLDQLGVQH